MCAESVCGMCVLCFGVVVYCCVCFGVVLCCVVLCGVVWCGVWYESLRAKRVCPGACLDATN